ALGHEALVFVPERLQTRNRPLKLHLRFSAARARQVALGAFQFDLGATAGTLVLQLHFIVANDAVDQLVPGNHPVPSALQLGSLLGSDLWPVSTGVRHARYSRSTFRTEAEHLAAILWNQNGAPVDLAAMQIVQSVVGLAELVFPGVEIDEAPIR